MHQPAIKSFHKSCQKENICCLLVEMLTITSMDNTKYNSVMKKETIATIEATQF